MKFHAHDLTTGECRIFSWYDLEFTGKWQNEIRVKNFGPVIAAQGQENPDVKITIADSEIRQNRKIISISSCVDDGDFMVYALCDDGTMWVYDGFGWKAVPDVPQK